MGESDGEPGKGTVKRTYRFVLSNKFLNEENVSTYPVRAALEKVATSLVPTLRTLHAS